MPERILRTKWFGLRMRPVLKQDESLSRFISECMTDITTAIIPIAGLGSRMLPLTHKVPKELFPLSSGPVIEYIVRDLVEAGIINIVFVVGPYSTLTPEYFSPDASYIRELKAASKLSELEPLLDLCASMKHQVCVQPEAKGDGDALLRAQEYVEDEQRVYVRFGDELLFCQEGSGVTQMLSAAKLYGGSLIATQEVEEEAVSNFGIVGVGPESLDLGEVQAVKDLQEKPKPEEALSRLAVIGSYVIEASVLEDLRRIRAEHKGELRLIDALKKQLLQKESKLRALHVEGQRFDVGQKEGWIRALDFLSKQQEI